MSQTNKGNGGGNKEKFNQFTTYDSVNIQLMENESTIKEDTFDDSPNIN